MSISISVSNNSNNHCEKILKQYLKAGISCRTIDTTSISGNKIEKGCLITLEDINTNREYISKIWNIIKKDYVCGHLKIEGVFSGCLYNYTNVDCCGK